MARKHTPARICITLLAALLALTMAPFSPPAHAASTTIRSSADWQPLIELTDNDTLTIASSASSPGTPVTIRVTNGATIIGGGHRIDNIHIDLISGVLTLRNVDLRSTPDSLPGGAADWESRWSVLTVRDNAEINIEGKNLLTTDAFVSGSTREGAPAIYVLGGKTLRIGSRNNGLLTADGVDAANSGMSGSGGSLLLTSGQLYLMGSRYPDLNTGSAGIANVTITGGSLRFENWPYNPQIGSLRPLLVEVHAPPTGWVSGLEIAYGSYRAITNEDGEAYIWLPDWGSNMPAVTPYNAAAGTFTYSYDINYRPIPKLTMEMTPTPTTPSPTGTPWPTPTPRPADNRGPTILSATAQNSGTNVILRAHATDNISSMLAFRWQVRRDNDWHDLPDGFGPVNVRTDLTPGASYLFRVLVYDEAGNYTVSSDIAVTVGVLNGAAEGVPMTVYPSPKLGTVVGARVSVRKGPSSNHDEITVAYRGNTVYVLGYQGSWANIAWNTGASTINAWMHAGYLNWDNRPAVPAVLTAPVFVRSGPSPNYRALGTLSKDTQVNLLNRRGNYYLIMVENIACYIHARYCQMLY